MNELEITARSGWQQDSTSSGGPQLVPRCLLDLARQDQGELYAIIDGARDDRVYREISRDEVVYQPLYRGETEKYFSVSPILARCQADTQLFQWLTTEAWGQGHALYLTSRAPLERLADHFARFTVVRTEDDEKLFFRYYDPRVLQVYLPACSVPERELLFGPAVSLAAESAAGSELLLFDRQGGGLGAIQDQLESPTDEPRISSAQMDVFTDYMLRQFIDTMVVSLRAASPRRCDELGGEGLRVLIRDGILSAKEHGVLLERDVERYLQCSLRHGEGFGEGSEADWADEILSAEGVTGTVKMNRIEARERELSAEKSS